MKYKVTTICLSSYVWKHGTETKLRCVHELKMNYNCICTMKLTTQHKIKLTQQIPAVAHKTRWFHKNCENYCTINCKNRKW